MTDYEVAILVDERRRLYARAIREKTKPRYRPATVEDLEDEAAEIKLRLYLQGIVLHDTATGTTWSRRSEPNRGKEVNQ